MNHKYMKIKECNHINKWERIGAAGGQGVEYPRASIFCKNCGVIKWVILIEPDKFEENCEKLLLKGLISE